MATKQRNRRLERAVIRLMPETFRMAALQSSKVFQPLYHAPARLVEAKADELIRKRHARRKARTQQKVSRRRNAR